MRLVLDIWKISNRSAVNCPKPNEQETRKHIYVTIGPIYLLQTPNPITTIQIYKIVGCGAYRIDKHKKNKKVETLID